jgi:hypothetical protein
MKSNFYEEQTTTATPAALRLSLRESHGLFGAIDPAPEEVHHDQGHGEDHK